MSGSLPIPLMTQVADPWKPLQAYQNILKTEADRYKTQAETATEYERPAYVRAQAGLLGAQTGETTARTGYIGAQTVGQQIDNILKGINTQFRQQGVEGLTSGAKPATAEPEMPWSQSEGGPTGVDLLTPGGGSKVAATPPAAQPAAGGNALAMYGTTAEAAAPAEVGTPALDETMKRLRAQQAAAGGGNELAAATPAAAAAPAAAGAPPAANPLATGGAAPAAPAAAPAGSSAETARRAARMQQPSPNGLFLPTVGGSVPRNLWYSALAAPGTDVFKAQAEMKEDRRKTLFQAVAATGDDAVSWNSTVRSLYEQGWLTKGEVDHFYNHPELKPAVIRSLGTAEGAQAQDTAFAAHGLEFGPTGPRVSQVASSTMEPVKVQVPEVDGAGKPIPGRFVETTVPRGAFAQKAIDDAKAAGEQMVTVTRNMPGSDGREYPTQFQVPASSIQRPGAAGAPAAGGAPGAAAGGVPFQRYATLLQGQEGGATGEQNRMGSSAVGRYQWLNGTWLDTVKKYAPDVAAGKSDAEILALRNSPLEEPMLQAFTAQNAEGLTKLGIPVNASTLRLAHWFGPEGMAKIMKAPASMLVSDIASPEVVRLNKLQGVTVGQLATRVKGQFGLAPVDLGPSTGAEALGMGGGAPAAAAPAAPGGAAVAPAVGVAGAVAPRAPDAAMAPQTQLPPGSYAGAPKLTPEAQADLDVLTRQRQEQAAAAAAEPRGAAEAYAGQSKAIIDNAASAPQKLERLAVLENAANEFRPGMSGAARAKSQQGLVDALGAIGITLPDNHWLRRGATGSEVIGKEGGYLAAEMTKSLGSREAASVFNQVRDIQPNLRMTEGGYQAIIQSIRQGVVRDQQLGTFREQWLADPRHNNTIAGMQDAFNASHPIEQYASRVLPYPMPKKPEDAKDNVVYRAPNGERFISWKGRYYTQEQYAEIAAAAAGAH